ncbi:MAG: SRPBCC family protein [Rubellimicrobium sp.]|nr:SRPBCC family protein [Rubellimicrobium sp.]
MELTSEHDIAAPRARVFAALADPAEFERRLAAARVQVRRLDAGGEAWELRFRLRGAERHMHLTRSACESPANLAFTGSSPAFAIENRIALTEAGPDRTRMRVAFVARPQSMGARVALQGLKLARGRLQRRFDAAVARLAAELAAG